MPDPELEKVFLDERPRLFQIAYRMMGTVSDAEDALQDVFVNLRAGAAREVAAPRPYLTQAVVRRCLDQWRTVRRRREEYVGPWLPEPLAPDADGEPQAREELAESVSLAFLVVLESLTPVERAVFLLHDIFQYSFEEIATTVDRSAVACRQLAHRAREKVRENRPRFPATAEQHRQLVSNFMQACRSGDLAGLQSVLAEDVVAYSDGGGLTRAARAPVVGLERVTRFLLGLRGKAERYGVRVSLEPCTVNGILGMMQLVDGRLHSVVSFEAESNQIRRLYSVLNPQKLAAIAAAHNLERV